MARLVPLTSPDVNRARMLAAKYQTPETKAAYLDALAAHLRTKADELTAQAEAERAMTTDSGVDARA